MSLDSGHRWRSEKTLRWLQANGLSSVPRNIKEEIGSLVYKLDREKDPDDLTPPPGLFVFNARSRASNDPAPGL